jgi:glycosyltransferase involved in cell wall biosynthesis
LKRSWVIVAGDFSPAGGMDKANYHLAWHLAERPDSEVHLVAHRVAEPLAGHPRVRIHAVRRPLGRHFLGGLLLKRAARRVARRVLADAPRARVIANGANSDWPDVNWVHMVHHACPCQDAGAPLLFRLRNRVSHLLARKGERRSLAHSRLVLVNSEKTAHEVIDRLGVAPARVKVVYLGVDPHQFGAVSPAERDEARRWLGVPDDRPLAVFIGALGYDRNKGFDTLLAACHELAREPGLSLLVRAAGAGALGYWQGRIDGLGLTDRVRLLGHVTAVARLLAAADVLVSPTRYDAYGLGVHEALCRGIPAIVSTAAGIGERYPQALAALLLRRPGDAGELAALLRSWHARREDFRRAAEEFGARLRSYTWIHMAARMVELIEETSC